MVVVINLAFHICKGIDDFESLSTAFDILYALELSGLLWVESGLLSIHTGKS